MTKKLRFAILRARHDANPSPISDEACRSVLMSGGRSVFDYWTQASDGYFDFSESVMFPWVRIQFKPEDVAGHSAEGANPWYPTMVRRGAQYERAVAATCALPGVGNIDGFDGYILLTYPGDTTPDPRYPPGAGGQVAEDIVFDGGSTGVGPGFAVVAPVATSTHSFLCHEVGHVLGFVDGYGIWASPPQNLRYGDPFDIMSTATFGDSNPSFVGLPFDGWPVPILHQALGPAPARAQMHHLDAATVASAQLREVVVASSNDTTVELFAAFGESTRKRLTLIRPMSDVPSGLGRCYIEYRDAHGWDAGLDTSGGDLARRSVVLHVVTQTSDAGAQCWYRGRIVVPPEVDSDLRVPGTPFNVRVVDSDVQARSVMLCITNSSPIGIDLVKSGHDDIVLNRQLVELQEPRHTPCGDTIRYAHWKTTSTRTYRPVTRGLGGDGMPSALPVALNVTWRVGRSAVDPATAALLQRAADEGTFNLEGAIDLETGALTLKSRPGEHYHMDVECVVTAPDGTSVATATRFEPTGGFAGYTPGDLFKIARCEAKILRDIRFNLRDFELPHGPSPVETWNLRRELPALIGRLRALGPQGQAYADALRLLDALRTPA